MSGLVHITRLLALIEDLVRLRILFLLRRRELCVCELVDALGGMPQYKVSRHLGALRRGKVVVARRQGRWMHYRLDTMAAGGRLAARLIELLDREVGRVSELRADEARLEERLRLRQSGQCVVGNQPVVRATRHRGDGRTAKPSGGTMRPD